MATIEKVAPILEDCAARLLDRLDDLTRRFDRALEIGGRGVVGPMLSARGMGFVVSGDLAVGMAARGGGIPVAMDEEFLPFAEESFDLVVASLSLHQVNDLPGAMIQIRRVLAPDGLFLASVPGLGTLQGVREGLAEAEMAVRGGVSPRVSPFPTLQDCAGLLQRAGFALPVADAEEVVLRYRRPMGVFEDLRAAGEQNAVLARDGRVPPRAMFPMAAAGFAEEVVLKLLVMTGWAPAESQSRAARPGSATVRLADALGVVEGKAGEKAGR